MQTIIEHINNQLQGYYSEQEIRAMSRLLLAHITGLPFASVLAGGFELNSEQQVSIAKAISRLQQYEPIQYVLGETEFFGMTFYVTPDTLIPRPETEELVELILNENTLSHQSVLDIGTGSGCIAIALARHMKQAVVTAWDISSAALLIAASNATSNAVSVQFAEVDILDDYTHNKKFDVLVSNPPYVLESEKMVMEANVLQYEPHTALFVPDNNPLLFYERIADVGKSLLNDGGKLYFEINRAKGNETVTMLQQKGYSNVNLHKDLSGNDRIISAFWLNHYSEK